MKKNIGETIEFFTPEHGLDVTYYIQSNNKQGIHHIGRYQWASNVLQGNRILDVACGAGYGTKMLADKYPMKEFIGVDYDARAIEYAQSRYQAPNLTYAVGNLATWEFQDSSSFGQVDCVISFDTIEHLLHREIALLRIAENLLPTGMLLLSTPVKSTSILNPGWEHHKIEYSRYDLYSLLRRFFRQVQRTDDNNLPNQVFWDEVINKDQIRYTNKTNPVVCLEPIKII